MAEAESRLIVGTAGHVDHGKTSLVRALTGVDTDRLAEEKARGITIELGFAELPLDGGITAGVVDVPGHEDFVRTMVAGASGVDVGLLVVAADEGVMPQTVEHLAILDFMGVQRLVVALTKVDGVDEEWLALVRDDVESRLEGTRFAGSPQVATSATTGAGVEELRALLATVANELPPRSDDDLARLPVDRSFTIRGTGTVITGTVWSGRFEVGKAIRVLPGQGSWRIRGIEVHGRAQDHARVGERAALALAGAKTEEVTRGQQVVIDRAWEATTRLTVRVRTVSDRRARLERGRRVRVHVGTAEVMARVYPIGPDVEPDAAGWVTLRLEAPLVARARDPIVIRSYSPMTTIAGGVVAEAHPLRRRRRAPSPIPALEAVVDAGPAEAIQGVLALRGARGVEVSQLSVHTGMAPTTLLDLAGSDAAGWVRAGEWLFAAERTQDARTRVLERVGRFHREQPVRTGIAVERVRAEALQDVPEPLARRVLDDLTAAGDLVIERSEARLTGHEVTLDGKAEAVRDRLLAEFARAGLSPPRIGDLIAPDDREVVWAVVRHMERSQQVVAIEDDLFLDREALEEGARRVRATLAGRSELGPADFKEALPVSRRHLLPVLAFFDRLGLTERQGESRSVPSTPGTSFGSES